MTRAANPNRNGPDSVWSEDRVQRLVDLWTAGVSASQIAVKLGEGISRSAVLGKVRRLELPARRTVVQSYSRPGPKSGWSDGRRQREAQRRGTVQRAISPRPARVRIHTPPEVAPVEVDRSSDAWVPLPETAPVSLVARKIGSQCAWPVGDGRVPGMVVCGCPVQDGRSYCPTHVARGRTS